LFNWLYTKAYRRRDADEAVIGMISAFKAELVEQSKDTIREIADALTVIEPERGLEGSAFTAALDIIELGQLSETIDPAPITDAYISSVEKGSYGLSVVGLSPELSAILLELASRLTPDRKKEFLSPLKVRERLAAGAQDNPYIVADTIARSIRTHVRVLGRAVAGSKHAPELAVVDALIAAVRSGAISHTEKARVAAFSRDWKHKM
jgi:hypothetical protein